MMDDGGTGRRKLKSWVLIKSMKFNCIPEFFSLLCLKERKGVRRKRGKEEVFIWAEQEAQSILALYYRERMCENSLWHTGKAIPASDLSYCAHFSMALRTPNSECATSSQKPDLQLALQVKTWVPQADSCCCFPLSLYPGKTQQKGRGTSLFLSL